jgi:hypothetical protein
VGSCASNRGADILGRIRPPRRLSNVAPHFCESSAGITTRTRVRVWFQDEARFAQQGTLTAVWAIKASRPTVVRQHGRKSIWVFAAVEPATGWSMAIPYREVNTETMQAFLDAEARRLYRREHAVMILDRAGWHCSHKLRWPRRVTRLFLPPYSLELNPVERLWHWFREHH